MPEPNDASRSKAAESPFASPQTPPGMDQGSQGASPPPDKLTAWSWVPTLYFAEGLPYVLVMTVSVIMYKSLGIDNDQIALYTSLLYLPWVIKPLWSPLVDVLGTQRRWILLTQFLMAAAFFGIAMVVESSNFFVPTLAFFWLLAICSATHDIAADGIYMEGLNKQSQAWFVGIRSTFYKVAMIAGQGGLVMLAGRLEQTMSPATAWRWTLIVAAALYVGLCVYHQFLLPRPRQETSDASPERRQLLRELREAVASFFNRPHIGLIVAYLLLYRFAEAQLAKIAAPFLMDAADAGGLELSTSMVGKLYGVAGVSLLLAGGILGGVLGSRYGVRRCLLPMAAAINLPNVVYVFLAYFKPSSIWLVGGAVAVEQFGYGLGFAGYMLTMLHVSRGMHKTTQFALCTGLMALGMMLPGMFCGDLQLWIGYEWFFVWVLVATIPSFVVTALLQRVLEE